MSARPGPRGGYHSSGIPTAITLRSPRRNSLFRDLPMVGLLLFGLESPAHPEHVAIRMTKVHLADVPRHIGGRKCDLQPGGDALLVHLVHVVHPDRHPDSFVTLFVSVVLKGRGVCAA